jgi:creatinine amidohydrolase/Fe(II)-dependent formamide hydrolase-like protein
MRVSSPFLKVIQSSKASYVFLLVFLYLYHPKHKTFPGSLDVKYETSHRIEAID